MGRVTICLGSDTPIFEYKGIMTSEYLNLQMTSA